MREAAEAKREAIEKDKKDKNKLLYYNFTILPKKTKQIEKDHHSKKK